MDIFTAVAQELGDVLFPGRRDGQHPHNLQTASDVKRKLRLLAQTTREIVSDNFANERTADGTDGWGGAS